MPALLPFNPPVAGSTCAPAPPAAQVGDAAKVVAAASAQGVNLRQVTLSSGCALGCFPMAPCHDMGSSSRARAAPPAAAAATPAQPAVHAPHTPVPQLDASTVTIALDETTTLADVDQLFSILNGGKGACGLRALMLQSWGGSAAGSAARRRLPGPSAALRLRFPPFTAIALPSALASWLS